jgi:hypothetical protein
MRIFLFLVLLLVSSDLMAQGLAEQIREAHGDWADVKSVEFTWTAQARGMSRTYVWDRTTGRVKATIGDTTVDIPATGAGLRETNEIEAHKAFINDSYWLLFEQFIFRDDVELVEGAGKIPGQEGESKWLEVRYSSGGYTPGDTYRLYVNDKGVVFGWAYFPGGQKEPRFYLTREALQTQAGITFPTDFKQDSKTVIKLENVKIR